MCDIFTIHVIRIAFYTAVIWFTDPYHVSRSSSEHIYLYAFAGITVIFQRPLFFYSSRRNNKRHAKEIKINKNYLGLPLDSNEEGLKEERETFLKFDK